MLKIICHKLCILHYSIPTEKAIPPWRKPWRYCYWGLLKDSLADIGDQQSAGCQYAQSHEAAEEYDGGVITGIAVILGLQEKKRLGQTAAVVGYIEQPLSEEEQKLLGWSAKRELAKINYRIHTETKDLLNQND